MNDLNKSMTNIKWKKTTIDVATLGLLMRANLIRKGCQNKLMKGISSIQKGLMIYYMIILCLVEYQNNFQQIKTTKESIRICKKYNLPLLIKRDILWRIWCTFFYMKDN